MQFIEIETLRGQRDHGDGPALRHPVISQVDRDSFRASTGERTNEDEVVHYDPIDLNASAII